jgi:hypothetical protein
MDREQIAELDMLKMDVEGAEHEVFPATPTQVLRRIRHIGLEYHPNGSKSGLFALLTAAGFDLVQDAPTPLAPNSGVAHFCRN